jgi:glyoxylase-like metal-dependent hydrolase (beta-lactamase superfamily II)
MAHDRFNEISDDVIRIDFGMVACYLIKFGTWYVQVDTGYINDFQKYIRALQENGIKLSDIKYIFLTHHHDDHAGMLSTLAELNPEVKIIAHKKSAYGLALGRNILKTSARCPNLLCVFLLRMKKLDKTWTHKFPAFTFRETDILIDDNNDGMPLDSLGIKNGVVMCTRGHSEDHISLVFPGENAFVGDAAVNFLAWTRTFHTETYIEDLQTYYDDWKRLHDMFNVKTIYPSHGRPFGINLLLKDIGRIKHTRRFPKVTGWMCD